MLVCCHRGSWLPLWMLNNKYSTNTQPSALQNNTKQHCKSRRVSLYVYQWQKAFTWLKCNQIFLGEVQSISHSPDDFSRRAGPLDWLPRRYGSNRTLGVMDTPPDHTNNLLKSLWTAALQRPGRFCIMQFPCNPASYVIELIAGPMTLCVVCSV